MIINGGDTVTVPSVAQPSPWNIGTDLIAGYDTPGTLHIESGGIVSNGIAIIGEHTGGDGVVTVDGSGSKWTNADDVSAG
jgi:hypothetical protein